MSSQVCAWTFSLTTPAQDCHLPLWPQLSPAQLLSSLTSLMTSGFLQPSPPGVLRPDKGAGPQLSEISSPVVTSQVQCIYFELYSSCFSPCPKHLLLCLSTNTAHMLLFCQTFPTHLSLPLSSVAGLILCPCKALSIPLLALLVCPTEHCISVFLMH